MHTSRKAIAWAWVVVRLLVRHHVKHATLVAEEARSTIHGWIGCVAIATVGNHLIARGVSAAAAAADHVMIAHVVWGAVMPPGLTVVVVATGTSRTIVTTAVVASAIMATVFVVVLHVGWRDGCAAMLHRA
jgi:hypothetical protein